MTMTAPKKAAAKKTTAPRKRAPKKVTARPQDVIAGPDADVAPDGSTVYAAGAPVYGFPLAEDGYFSVPVTSRRSTSRGAKVILLRHRLGLTPRGEFDEEMAEAVGRYQREHDLPYTRVVDRATWEHLFAED
jgi:peptidoglycan hydrolase-like protein with peptidoglycan-binding domain